MMRIESGPTGERVVRSSLLCLLCTVFAIWFAYDGWVGYAKGNLAGYLKTLTAEDRKVLDQRGGPTVLPGVTEAAIQKCYGTKFRINDDVRKIVEASFGGPPSHENNEAWFYFGPAAGIRLTLKDGRPSGELTPIRADHTETDLKTQKGISVVLGVISIFTLIHAIRVRTTRAVLDDAGLALGARPPIAWDAMKSLDISRFKAKGWADLYHTTASGETRTRLDEYHYKAFDEMMNALCERKGFENPLYLLENPERNPKAAGRSTPDATDSSAS